MRRGAACTRSGASRRIATMGGAWPFESVLEVAPLPRAAGTSLRTVASKAPPSHVSASSVSRFFPAGGVCAAGIDGGVDAVAGAGTTAEEMLAQPSEACATADDRLAARFPSLRRSCSTAAHIPGEALEARALEARGCASETRSRRVEGCVRRADDLL